MHTLFWYLLVVFYKKTVFLSFLFLLFWWIIKITQEDINQSETGVDDNECQWNCMICIGKQKTLEYVSYKGADEILQLEQFSALHKKWSFPWRISSVNVTKSAGDCGLVTFIEKTFHEKFHFLYSANDAKWHLMQYLIFSKLLTNFWWH